MVNYHNVKHHVAELAQACHRNPKDITVVAVSKGYPYEELRKVYEAGCRDFGENRLPEALEKMDKMPPQVNWHWIGSLQKNKVRKVVGKFSLIHSVDNPELAKKLSEVSEEMNIETRILLQANTSGELSKHGLSPEEWKYHYKQILNLPMLKIEGLMAMAPLTEDEEIIRHCFRNLRILRDELNKINPSNSLMHLSMGMTHDYPIAIQEGATILRIGHAIFNL